LSYSYCTPVQYRVLWQEYSRDGSERRRLTILLSRFNRDAYARVIRRRNVLIKSHLRIYPTSFESEKKITKDRNTLEREAKEKLQKVLSGCPGNCPIRVLTVLLCSAQLVMSGIRVESRERVTFAPTPMKRFHDLQQFHSHWTR